MRYWKNTNTLDNYVPELLAASDPAEAEIAVIGSKPIELDKFPSLLGIFKCGIGQDNIPFEECSKHGIKIGLPSPGTTEIIYEETANFAMHTILTMIYQNSGNLEKWIKYERSSLITNKVLIIGLGNIGNRVKLKLTPLTTVMEFDITVNKEEELEYLIPIADVISLHIPLNKYTENWFDDKKLSLMHDGSALVNTARGRIVDESALYKEIESGRLRAAFDVFWNEPYYGPLREFHPERFRMTPHIASTCREFIEGLAADFRIFVSQI